MFNSTKLPLRPKPRAIIVGLVRNCENSLLKEYSRIILASESLEIIDSFFVESDSSDKSTAVLDSMMDKINNFHFVSLGNLESKIPHRIQRIRFCRNEYVKYIRERFDQESFEFVIVADMDGINSALSKSAINSCFKYRNWDALFSNQFFGVSDLLALRAKNWIEGDYLIELELSRFHLRNAPQARNLLRKFIQFLRYDKTRRKIIYNRMRFLGFNKNLIPVNSAFGGLGVYRSWCFFKADYSDDDHPYECEHVSFHRKLEMSGARMFINPRLINSILNTYNVNKIFLIRNLRIWRWNRRKPQS